MQAERFDGQKGLYCNAQMSEPQLERFAPLDAPSQEMLVAAMKRLGLSARAYGRIRKVARTIADLEGAGAIASRHVAEAVGYRNLDRSSWGE